MTVIIGINFHILLINHQKEIHLDVTIDANQIQINGDLLVNTGNSLNLSNSNVQIGGTFELSKDSALTVNSNSSLTVNGYNFLSP